MLFGVVIYFSVPMILLFHLHVFSFHICATTIINYFFS